MNWLMKRWHRGLFIGWALAFFVPDRGTAHWVGLVLGAVVMTTLFALADERESRAAHNETSPPCQHDGLFTNGRCHGCGQMFGRLP